MEIALTRKIFHDEWKEDRMCSGDSIRSREWEGQLLTIELNNNDNDNKFLVSVVEEAMNHRRLSLSVTVEEIKTYILNRAKRLEWAYGWASYYGIVRKSPNTPDGFRVGIDYTSPDNPEVYTPDGNYICRVPQDIEPGNFVELEKYVLEYLEEL